MILYEKLDYWQWLYFWAGVGDGIDIRIFLKVGFMQRDQFSQQHQNNDTFYTPSVVKPECIIRSEKLPDAGILCNYAIDNYSQAFGDIFSCFRHSAKDNVLQPYIYHTKRFHNF